VLLSGFPMILPALLLMAAQGQGAPGSPGFVPPPPIQRRTAAPPPAIAPQALPPGWLHELEQVRTPPQPRGSIESLFSFDDYPASGDGRRGKISVWLMVAPSGMLSSCFIRRSSGQSALDMATCNILRRRARFVPAIDRNGNPSVGAISVTVDWDAVFKRTGLVRR